MFKPKRLFFYSLVKNVESSLLKTAFIVLCVCFALSYTLPQKLTFTNWKIRKKRKESNKTIKRRNKIFLLFSRKTFQSRNLPTKFLFLNKYLSSQFLGMNALLFQRRIKSLQFSKILLRTGEEVHAESPTQIKFCKIFTRFHIRQEAASHSYSTASD